MVSRLDKYSTKCGTMFIGELMRDGMVWC